MHCTICGNIKNNIIHKAKEMNFGFRDEFEYLECSHCGCVQLLTIPDNVEKYYPVDYYSKNIKPDEWHANPEKFERHKLKRFVKKIILKNYLLGNLDNSTLLKYLPLNFELKSLSQIPLNKKQKILDVGCGNGWLLYLLIDLGFKNLYGIDPFINDDINYSNDLSINKTTLGDLNGIYDVIIYNHSFEHIRNPYNELSNLYSRMHDKSICVVRIPVAGESWKIYKGNFVQLDAPRHYFLYSVKSFDILLRKNNFTINKIIYESTLFQFWASELYRNNISLNEINFRQPEFSKYEMDSMINKAKLLQNKEKSDQVAIYFKKNGNNNKK